MMTRFTSVSTVTVTAFRTVILRMVQFQFWRISWSPRRDICWPNARKGGEGGLIYILYAYLPFQQNQTDDTKDSLPTPLCG